MNSQAQAIGSGSRSGFKVWWYRWRFHLSVLAILIPLCFVPRYIKDQALFSGDLGLGVHDLGTKKVGPWEVHMAEFDALPPRRDGTAGFVKTFSVSLCESCRSAVRAVYLRVGKPRSLRTAGAIGFGSVYNMQIGVLIPKDTAPDAQLWLTAEGWDGSWHSTSFPLAEASPVTMKWLGNR
ncbi:hypothetical protein TKWG_08705 [Advenella kashmirensis WT001]|uniref:Thiamine pyrophosphate-binding protein n=1 Tax=Advenella kashmirensis (strain DSM 17095 / LMG 22695 / WT001) TaxID=1036672 RepID=I3UAQ7_ADVKW|nr:hypothetical protein [Advenella kashmirensis]AFK62095.1 hypothetical protein TKWG_08705 [Advenella kashmirensis WT001]